MKKRPEIVEEWYFTEYEPDLLDQYNKLSPRKVNYRISYSVLVALVDELGFVWNDTEIIFTRRRKDRCGSCKTLFGLRPNTNKHKITLHKGYYTLGVLIHEFAHAIAFQRKNFRKIKKAHGYIFKGWFTVIVRLMDHLAKTDRFVIDLWDEAHG